MKLHLPLLLLVSTANALTWNSAKTTRAISPDSISTDESDIIVTLPATTSTVGATIDVNGGDVNATVFPSTGATTTGATGTTGAATTGATTTGTTGAASTDFTSTTGATSTGATTTTGISVNEADVNVDTGMSVEEVSGYYADTVADYYGSGVSVTVDKVESSSSSSYGSVSGSSSYGSVSGSTSGSGVSTVVKGGGSKKKGTFWSAHASKGSVTGKCLYTKGSSTYKNSIEGSSTSYSSYKGSAKKSRSSQETCVCTEKRRELQWGNDGHSSGGNAVKVSSGGGGGSTANKVSGGSSANKVTSGSSKVTTVKVSGTSSKMTGGMWAGDAHGATSKVTGSSSKVTSTATKVSGTSSKMTGGMWAGDAHGATSKVTGSSSKVTSTATKVSGTSSKMTGGMWAGDAHGAASKVTGSSSKVTSTATKVSGTSSKMTGGMWAGDAHGAASKVTGSSSKVTSNKSTAAKVTGTSSKMTGGMWAGDAHGVSKMTTEKTSKITSIKGSSVSFKSAVTSEMTDSKSTKTVVSATWEGNSWGPSKVTTVTNNKGSTVPSVKESSVSVKGSSSFDYYCSCETSFEVDVCESPTPSPINPLAPQPSVPLDSNAPSVVENIEVNEIVCVDDFAMTTAGVSVEIPVLDNDGTIPNGISGSITQPNNGLAIISDSSILYIPNSNCCGVDTFTYTINNASGQAMCTASVTVSIVCTGDANTPSPTVTPTDEIIPNGGDLNITENITDSPSAVPINPDGGDLNIAKPVANDDYYTTNQDESIEIAILKNDTLIVGTTGSYTMPPNGQLSTIEDNLLYTPDAGFCGSDMFSYTLTDATGEYSDSAVVTIDVICAEVPTPSPQSDLSSMPTYFTGDDLLGVPPDFTTNSSAPSPQPTLYDGDDAIGVNQNFNGTQPSIDRPELEDDYAITNLSVPVFIPILDNDVIPSDSTGSMGVAMHGEIDASVDGIVYTPADYFCGFEKFEYSVTDSTGKFTDTAQVTIEVICVDSPTPSPTLFTGDDLVGVPPEFSKDTVAPSPSPTLFTGDDMIGVPPNFNNTEPDIDRPELNDDYATTNQGEPVIIPILANDTIPTDSTGSFTKPEHGVVTMLTGDDVLYTPDQEFCGTDSFTYTIKDTSNNADTATVTVDVVCEENVDQPIANDDDVTTPQGVPVIIPATENDYIPNNATGEFDQPSSGFVTLVVDGVVYTPAADFCGLDVFDYTITDASGMYSDSATVTVNVTCSDAEDANIKPDAVNDYVTIPQDSPPIVVNVLDNDSAPDGYELYVDSLTYNANNGKCSISDDQLSVVYTPNEGYSGQDSCVYTACIENGHCDMAIVLVTIEPSAQTTSTEGSTGATTSVDSPDNHVPVAKDDEANTPQNQPVFINVAANDEDKDDDALIVTSVAECKAGGSLVIIGDGTGGVVEYTPASGFYGTDHCDYTICDEHGACNTACVVVTVEKPSAPPLAVNDAVKTEVDVAIEIEVTENDISPNGSPLNVVSVGQSEKGAVVEIAENGTSGFVFYEPPAGFVGNDEFNYTIVDGEGQTSTAIVYVTVNSEKEIGVITSAVPTSISPETTTPSFAHSCSTDQDSSVIYVIDKDPCASITSVTGGANGVCEVTGKGTITYTPDAGFTGTDECEYELCKDSSCSSGVLTITVVADGSASETSSTKAAAITSTAAETTSTTAAETTSTTAVDTTSSIQADTTTSTIMAETTTTKTPVTENDSGNVTELPSASYMCPEVDPSNVTKNTLLYKYEVVLGEGADVEAAIEVIELEMNDLLASQMRCSMSGSGRSLLIAGLVGADSNPVDTLSDEECESGNAGCVVVNGGLTVYGDADIEEVQSYLGSVMPDIVSSVNATVIEERLNTSSAMLESSDATAEGKSNNVTTVAIAGAAVVALLGAAMFLRKRQSHEELSDESEAVLRDEFPQKTVEIPNGSSNEDSDTLLTSSTSFESKSKKSLKSVFRNNGDDGRPNSPAFSVSSSKSKSYNIEDTVDL